MDPLPALPSLLQTLLVAGVAPLWLLTGSLDAACHRYLHVEHNSGAPESLLHLAMLLQLGLGIGAALLLELNAAAFLLMFAALIAHEGTMWADLAYASSRRPIPWYEQLVHGVQHSLPWVGLVILVLLHPTPALSVFGLGSQPADWRLLPKQHPLPIAYVLGFVAAGGVFVIGPFVMEFLRCLRVRRAGSAAAARWPAR